jgi:hypothetical protein
MSVIEGVDYAFAPHPSIAALKAAKKKFVVRYIGSKDYTKSRSDKWLSRAEYASLRANGIEVAVVFETTAKRAESGKSAGATDAKIAKTEIAYLGLPADIPVYFAVDYDDTVGPNIRGYFDGIKTVLPKSRIGAYGGYKILKVLFDEGRVTYGWQTYAWSYNQAKGATDWDKRAQLQQYANGKSLGGATVDYTRATVANYGQAGSATPSTPPPAPKPPANTSSAPSWDAVYSLIKKQKAKYAKGRRRENVNDYTNWFYKSWNIKAQFCFIGISWILAHAGPSESAGLALIGGKQSYVPAIRGIKGYRSGHSGMKVGAIVAVSGFNHIGFCTEIHSNGTFELYSFNTTYDGSDDAVWPKTYSLSSVSGYVNLAYGTGEDDDFMAEYVSIDKTSASRHEELVSGEWHQIYFNKNNSSASKAQHAEGDYPSILSRGHDYYTGHITLRISDLPKGTEGQIRCLYVDKESKVIAHCDIDEFVGSSGDTFVKTPVDGFVPAGQKMRVEVIHYGPADVRPKVVEGYVRLHVKGA